MTISIESLGNSDQKKVRKLTLQKKWDHDIMLFLLQIKSKQDKTMFHSGEFQTNQSLMEIDTF